MQSKLGPSYSDDDIKDFLWSTLNAGQVVPGYGHAVLRKPDPRFTALMDFASLRPEIAEDPLYQLVERNSRIAPEVLQEHGKVRISSTLSDQPKPRVKLLIIPSSILLLLQTDQEPLPQRRRRIRHALLPLRPP